MKSQEIATAAMKLDPKKRARLAARLIESLREEEEKLSPGEWERLWAEEAERRLTELRQGKAKEIPAEEVFARARDVASESLLKKDWLRPEEEAAWEDL